MNSVVLQHIYPDRKICVYRVGNPNEIVMYDNIKHIISLPNKVFATVDQCLKHILSVTDYSDLPKIINLNYKNFLPQTVPLADIIRAIRTCIALTTYRLGRGYESVRINFRIAEPISPWLAEYLNSIGVDNLVPDPNFWPVEKWQENIEKVIIGFKSWPDYLIDGNSELEITDLPEPVNILKLTPRQDEIVKLIMNRGYSNKEIAKHLKISESAVKLHVGMVLKKVGCKNRTQLSRALSVGLKA